MQYKKKYSIGDMSRIGHISRKALRHYDKIGLISPLRQDYNNYRYYTHESLLMIPVVKYYKQMGFKLIEMRSIIENDASNVYKKTKNAFLQKITELEKMREEIRRKHISVKDWYDLVHEAEVVLENDIKEVSVKYLEKTEFIFQEQLFNALDLKSAIINIDFTNFLEQVGNEIAGPVILNFSSHADRMQNKQQKIRIMQKALLPCHEEHKIHIGDCLMVSCYHIGSHETLSDTYRKIHRWTLQFGYTLSGESYERYVTDYWTTKNSAQFVTEVMMRVVKKTTLPLS